MREREREGERERERVVCKTKTAAGNIFKIQNLTTKKNNSLVVAICNMSTKLFTILFMSTIYS